MKYVCNVCGYVYDEEAGDPSMWMEVGGVLVIEKTEKTEEAAPTAEEMQEKGYTKVIVTAEEEIGRASCRERV